MLGTTRKNTRLETAQASIWAIEHYSTRLELEILQLDTALMNTMDRRVFVPHTYNTHMNDIPFPDNVVPKMVSFHIVSLFLGLHATKPFTFV